MRVKSSVLLERHFNAEGRPTEEAHTFEVLVAADVVADEVGPVEVTDAPEMDGPLRKRVLAFHPLRGHELVRASEMCWAEFLKQEREQQEAERLRGMNERAMRAAVEAVVRETMERVRKAKLPAREVLKALAGALEGGR